tara:strand:+ start:2639 stop:3916 length:1278 start_codon:yes stop_codon:yes gene_type:complete
MATAPTYCTHRQLKDVFPQVDSFDTKRSIYGWESLGNNVYVAYNTGLITQLFQDGKELNPHGKGGSLGIIYKTALTASIDIIDDTDAVDYNLVNYNASFSTGSESDLQVGDYVNFDDSTSNANEQGFIDAVNIDTNQITVRRAALGSTAIQWTSANTATVESYIRVTQINSWYYDSYYDQVILYCTSNPNDLSMEAGEDFGTLITRITANASRYLDSRLDPNLPREQLKDKEGNYDYMVVRTTSLIASSFLIKAHDATSEIATNFMEEVDKNIEMLNTGKASLSWQTTGDSSKGIIRDVSYTSGAIRPVDTRGRWSGSWDLIKVLITTGGVLGTAKYSVWTKSGDNLKDNQVVTDEIINGDYQTLAGGLQIRFGGSTDSSTANASGTADEWEIEVAGYNEEVDSSNIKSGKVTRGGVGIYGRKSY